MKTLKRVKGWVATWPDGALTEIQHKPLKPFPPGRCVRVVELRRGEVVVDVEALFKELCGVLMAHQQGPLRAALRKVGRR